MTLNAQQSEILRNIRNLEMSGQRRFIYARDPVETASPAQELRFMCGREAESARWSSRASPSRKRGSSYHTTRTHHATNVFPRSLPTLRPCYTEDCNGFDLYGTRDTEALWLSSPARARLPVLFSLSGIGGIMEFAGGLLILFGIFTRPVAFLLSGEMAVAYWMVHAPRSFFPVLNGGDASILYCFVFLLLVFTGPGAWSIDSLLARRDGRLEKH